MAEDLFGQNNGAQFSTDKKHRYRLWRIWNEDLPIAMCIGLNPSTANADKDDPTINNLRRALAKLGYGGFYMMNCWAYISSKPTELIKNVTVIDFCLNNEFIEETARKCKDVIFAWGTFPLVKEQGRDKELIEMFPNAKCFGLNQDKTPRHPLSLMYSGDIKNPQLFNYKDLINGKGIDSNNG